MEVKALKCRHSQRLVIEDWEQAVCSGDEAGASGKALGWRDGQRPGPPGGAHCPVQASSLPGTQCQGDDEAQDQQEHGDREQHCDDHHAPCPGHSQPNVFHVPSCQKRERSGLCGQEEPLSYMRHST